MLTAKIVFIVVCREPSGRAIGALREGEGAMGRTLLSRMREALNTPEALHGGAGNCLVVGFRVADQFH